MSQHIYIVDVSWGGHIADYHRLFIRYYLSQKHIVNSISPFPEEVRSWFNDLPGSSLNVIQVGRKDIELHGSIRYLQALVHKFPTRLSKRELPYSKWLRKFLFTVQVWSYINYMITKESCRTRNKPRLVLINYIDQDFMVKGFSRFIVDLVFNYKWACLYLSPTEFIPGTAGGFVSGSAIIPNRRDIFKSKNLRSILVSDERVVTSIKAYIGKKAIFLPEIVSKSLPPKETKLSVEIRKKSRGRKVICLAGVLAERKGVELFINSAQALLNSNYFFLMAGEVHSSLYNNKNIMNVLDAPPNNMFLYLEEIKGEIAFNELINLSDIVFIAYNNFYHGSGLLSRAVSFNKPVIASKGFLIGERVKKYDLGITIEENNLDQCIAAIKILTNNNMTQINSASKEYLNIHSISNFNKSLNILEKIIGKG